MGEGLFQPMHLLLILLVCVVVFGPKRLPELGKGLGEAIRGFRDGMNSPREQSATESPKQLASGEAASPVAEDARPSVEPQVLDVR